MLFFKKKVVEESVLLTEITSTFQTVVILEGSYKQKESLIAKIRKGKRVNKSKTRLLKLVGKEEAEFPLIDKQEVLLLDLEKLCTDLGTRLWSQVTYDFRKDLEDLNAALIVISGSITKQKEFAESSDVFGIANELESENVSGLRVVSSYFRNKLLQRGRSFFSQLENFEKERLGKIKDFWEKEISNIIFYHGTSSAGLDNIKRDGLKPNIQFIESSLLRFYERIADSKRTSDMIEICITHEKEAAEGFARRGPERLEFPLRIAEKIQEDGSDKVASLRDKQRLQYFIKVVKQKMKDHKPVLLYLNPRSKPIYRALPRKFKQCMGDFDVFLSLVNQTVITNRVGLDEALVQAKKESLDINKPDGMWELKLKASIPSKDILKTELL
ncbi:hypothetical protein HN592_04465 [Candidatus Woesearchaeota archaeon]|jgi:hypothetical protein|nr:hypothetical protein [Candidatus Woesearchaeota archaeon]MBT4368465.1 hypothetical protein [Candidatus Woesearchaeota archaeon]MBT4712954.1 hypothetical protein [Candidatus Woesearchaeota archaeon]MBT6639866.1 hypothetical protein [Candidatus Woesearchaeota archaeon]MBT7134038.1 hypothetical protein [Candidatus Woesearchaeota archaeon]